MVKRLPVVIFLFLLPVLLKAQADSSKIKHLTDTVKKSDLIDIAGSLFHIKSRPISDQEKKKFYFSILPISSSGASDGKVLITSTTVGYYLGNQHTTYLSTINFTPYFNFKGRYGLPIRSSIWLNNNSYNIQGDTRFMVYPQYTWGLGGDRPAEDKYLVNYKYLRLYQSALKRITSYFFAGIGYNMDYYIDIDGANGTNTTLRQFTNYKYGTQMDQNSLSAGASVNLLYDTRNNLINPLPGWYANLVYRYNPVFLGSDNNWQSLYIDVRKYIALTHSGPKNILAFWTYYWTAISPGVPYLSLPAIGMDPYQRSGRGIEQNRYRGSSLFYLEGEYRRDITANGLLGFVIFANLNAATQLNTRNFKYWNPAGGSGLRIKFNKKSNTNIDFDYGFSKDYSAFLLNLGEAF
ncbi:BamA/TamA family outer membrane protein [Mucilaginibacter sp.]|uniref:BamA/TamA family outer membrane protein n=1 Tax=Mucilaginibacter sp. TaxID=1882438 RepID=UPI00261DF6C4|nr:BamA/TamA family outer membrane protein [Mucilaginibacter sp.]MDB4926894.1 hypothetical protein [Mucilaginibacter sp.]